jgi:protein O-GlcNAc transferase
MSEQTIRAAYALHQSGKHEQAAQLYDQVLQKEPGNIQTLFLSGMLVYQRGDPEAALTRFDRILTLNPAHCDAHAARGAVLSSVGRHQDALTAYDRAQQLRPGSAQVYNNRANSLFALGRREEALENYELALKQNPAYADAWCNRAILLMESSRLPEALDSFQKAIDLRPAYSDAWEGRATVLTRLDRRAEAIRAYDRAIALKGPQPQLLYNRGNAHAILKNYLAAIADCEQALAADPDYPYARGVLAHARMQICEWRGLESQMQEIAAGLRAGKRVITPFNLKALSDSAESQLRCAALWTAHESPPAPRRMAPERVYEHRRIRIAYVSGDFANTAVAGLMAPVFELHDRECFETIAVSFGPSDHGGMRTRLQSAFENFVDVAGQGDFAIAEYLRRAAIDIAVDLMGFTGQCRSAIFAQRPAPLQVNYLGFPGSLGAPYYDYMIADRSVIPDEHTRFYAEQPALLPHCYLPADPARLNMRRTSTRKAAGLPGRGIVFASFNNTYKFAPDVFAVWMRLLGAIEGSVLWLPEGNSAARVNLIREARARGVTGERLIFAPPAPEIEDHLARLALADIFLDTAPYSSHSTAIDALTAGLPIVTVLGNSFASRVAASTLKAAGFSQLVTNSFDEYERLALELARDVPRLMQLKQQLAAQLPASPLFDLRRFTRDLERAYSAMYDRSRAGLPPAAFSVPL